MRKTLKRCAQPGKSECGKAILLGTAQTGKSQSKGFHDPDIPFMDKPAEFTGRTTQQPQQHMQEELVVGCNGIKLCLVSSLQH